ncbi:MAG TPA: hypothetical protein VFH88_13255, partial [Candidatus Krumholzibacteria bacterium]|nr:hypothetical protein [Candidatus Krumholzibacteria bacterium]
GAGAGAGFSPDGKQVSTLQFETSADGLLQNVVKVFPSDGGEALRTVHLPPAGTNYAPLPPAAILYVDRSDPHANVFKFSTVDGAQSQVSRFTEGRVTEVAAALDGKHIAVTRRNNDGENVWVMNADGSQPKQVTHFSGLDVAQMRWMPDSKRVVCTAGHTGNDVVLIRNFR